MGDVLIYNRKSCRDHAHYSGLLLVSNQMEAIEALGQRKVSMILIHLERERDDGMRLARAIRDLPDYYFTPIIFLAWDEHHKQEAFHMIHCYDYLVKPLPEAELVRIIYPFFCQNHLDINERCMKFRIDGEVYVVKLKDVVYMQCSNRKVNIYTTRGLIEVPYIKLKDCIEYGSHNFLQCHRSVAVNRSYIKRIDFFRKEIELWGAKVAIGRRYLEEIRNEFE